MPLTFGSLFAGIGGMDLGLERAGMQCKWQVEIDEYATRVLEKHWPDVARFRDVRECGAHNLEQVDLICGGFPCQDVSNAGPRTGLDGERSSLWFQMLRIVCAIRPRFVLVENVSALLNRGMGRVLSDLSSAGFDAEWRTLSASSFGAPHRRERVFIVAYPNKIDGQKRMGNFTLRPPQIFTQAMPERNSYWAQAPSVDSRVDDGVPARLYSNRVAGLGNAVVPQVAQYIGERIIASYATE